MHRTLLVTVSLFVASSFAAGAQSPAMQGTAVAVRSATPKVAASAAHGSVLSTIQGNALDSTNGPLAATVVRLRNARNGSIADTQVTDSSGLFTFKGVDPGSYIVEIMSKDQSILAAGQMLNVSAGDAISAVVKLPFRISPLAGVFGNSAASAVLVIAAAASAGVLSAAATQPVSPGS